MIKFSTLGLDRDGIDISGSEPSGFIDNADSELLSCCSPVEYELHAALVSNGILVTGKALAELKLECGRCLKTFKYKVKTTEICHFYEKVKIQELDVSDDIREDILIAFPTNYLCKEDCKGLCHKCGIDLNKSECSCSIDPSPEPEDSEEDSPWVELDKLDLKQDNKKAAKGRKTVKKR